MPDNKNTPKPPEPTKARKQCPACHHTHPQDVLQCEQCGLLFEKWRDPKQREAERRLQNIASDANQGLPKGVLLTLIAIVGVPLLIAFVPDVQSHAIGAKLRYRSARNDQFKFNNSLSVSVTGSNLPREYTFIAQLKPQLDVSETDSGNNNTYKKTYSSLSGEGFDDVSGVVEKSGLSAWQKDLVMGPRGDQITLMLTAATSMQQSAANMNRLNKARAEQRDYLSMGRRPEDPPEPTPREKAENYLGALLSGQLDAIDNIFFFHYPEKRIRSGTQWQQEQRLDFPAPFAVARLSETITFTISSFERTATGFVATVEWDSPVSITITTHDPQLSDPAQPKSQSTVAGTYKGKAIIDYTTGFINELEAECSAPFTSNEKSLLFKAEQRIHRI
jgi:hypothetical protein